MEVLQCCIYREQKKASKKCYHHKTGTSLHTVTSSGNLLQTTGSEWGGGVNLRVAITQFNL